jgi:NAD(P)-dependent dehydrogenase (short-subunit alcohol dehydrogenase family)
MANPGPPAYYGTNFTSTTHTTVPANTDPSKVHLPSPFVAVVTGAGKGLGYHIALAYAKAGCSGLSISSRTASDLDALAEEVEKVSKGRGVDVLKSVCDVQDDSSVAALVNDVKGRWGRVDVVVANAGIISKYIEPDQQEDGKKEEGRSNLPIGIIEDEDWSRVVNINLLGTWRISKAFMPLLTSTKDGAQTVCTISIPPLLLLLSGNWKN